MKFLKNLRMWFFNKKILIDRIKELHSILDIELKDLIKKIEVFEQDRLYVIELRHCSEKEMKRIQNLFYEAAKRIMWSAPSMILFTRNNKKQTEVINVERFNFFKPAYSDLLNKLGFGKLKIMECVKAADMNEGHIRIVLDWWASKGILTVDKSQKEFEVELTEQGIELVKYLNKIKCLFEPGKNEVTEDEVKENADATTKSDSIQSGE